MALEAHPGLDLFTEHLCNDLIEVCHDLDGELGLDATTADQIVERVCKSSADAGDKMTWFSIMLDGGLCDW